MQDFIFTVPEIGIQVHSEFCLKQPLFTIASTKFEDCTKRVL